MKTINIAELKTHLSQYLRRVRRGERFVVLDRHEPVAELTPMTEETETAERRLIREGLIRAPRRRPADVRLTPLRQAIRIQDLLDEVREDGR